MKLKRCLLLGRKAMTNLVKVLAAQLCTTLCNPVDCRPPGSSVHGILSARILEWVPIPFSRGSSEPREWIWVSCTAVRFSTIWATREVHEKPRQHIKKLRHHSGNKGRMWFFHWSCTDVKVGPWKNWVPKNWCFWIVVLEKNLESPLDFKEIQPVNPIGNQSWIYIGRTDAEAEAPILWPPHVKRQLIGKDPDDGEDWGQEEKRATDRGWLDGIISAVDMNLDKLRQIVKDREACCAAIHGFAESDTTERLEQQNSITFRIMICRKVAILDFLVYV